MSDLTSSVMDSEYSSGSSDVIIKEEKNIPRLRSRSSRDKIKPPPPPKEQTKVNKSKEKKKSTKNDTMIPILTRRQAAQIKNGDSHSQITTTASSPPPKTNATRTTSSFLDIEPSPHNKVSKNKKKQLVNKSLEKTPTITLVPQLEAVNYKEEQFNNDKQPKVKENKRKRKYNDDNCDGGGGGKESDYESEVSEESNKTNNILNKVQINNDRRVPNQDRDDDDDEQDQDDKDDDHDNKEDHDDKENDEDDHDDDDDEKLSYLPEIQVNSKLNSNQSLVNNFASEEEETRFECFRRSSFTRSNVRKIMQAVLSDNCKLNDNSIIAMSGITKVYIGEILELSKSIMNQWNEHGPIRPKHIREAYRRLKESNGIPYLKKTTTKLNKF